MNREEKIAEVLILNQIDYKDNDAIINAISKEGIYFSFYARGIRKPTSRNASSLQVFLLSSITYFESQKDIKLIKSSTPKVSYYDQFKTYEEILMAHIVLEVVNDISKLRVEANEDLFILAIESLNNVNKIDLKLFLSSFLAQVMKLLGLSLVCDHCAVCNSLKINYISLIHGGFICHNCLETNDKAIYSIEILKLFRLINKAKYSDLLKIEFKNEDINNLLSIMYQFYSDYSGQYIKNMSEFIDIGFSNKK